MPSVARPKRVLALTALVSQATALCVPKFESACTGNGELLKLRIGQNPFHSIDVGTWASQHAVDWDGDGDLDLVVGSAEGKVHYFTRFADGSIEELVGSSNPFGGIGGFSGFGGGKVAPHIVDWDGDGDLDLLAGPTYGRVAYFENDDGTLLNRSGTDRDPFGGVGVYACAHPRAVDWDGDGDLDLVVANDNLQISYEYFERLGNGTLVQRIGPGQNPFHHLDAISGASAWFVDWDGDGDLDVVVGTSTGFVTYYEQLADGSLEARTGEENPFGDVYVGGWAVPQAVDWDGDGDLDLIVAGADGQVRYYERISTGRLLRRLGAEPARDPFEVVEGGHRAMPHVVDWDGDGDLDVVLGTWEGEVQYYERLSKRSLARRSGPAQDPFHGLDFAGAAAPVVVDWDGDGDLDLLVGDVDGKVAYYEHTREGLVKRSGEDGNPFHDVDVQHWAAPQVFDGDGDGDLDLLVGDIRGDLQFYERVADGMLVQRFGVGQNPFHGINTNRGAAAPHVVDFDGDGDLDLVLGDWDGMVSYFEHLSDGSFVARVGPEDSMFYGIDVGNAAAPQAVDWDGDGDLDLVVGDMYRTGPVRFFERVTESTLVARTLPGQSPFLGVLVGNDAVPVAVDWDNDTDLDLVVGDAEGRVSYFERLDDGGLSKRSGPANPFRDVVVDSFAVPQAVDWDNDMDLDLLVGDGSGRVHYFERLANASLVRRIEPDKNPFHGVDVGSRAAPHAVDWDHDGDLDLLVGSSDGRVKYWERLADGSLVPANFSNVTQGRDHTWERLADGSVVLANFSGIAQGGGHTLPQALDFDGDGDLDLLVGAGDGQLAFYEHLPDGTLLQRRQAGQNPFVDVRVDGSFAAPQVVDWDSDGDLDLIVGDRSGRISFFERGGCLVLPTCSERGMCNYANARCQCLLGYAAEDCSTCGEGYSPREARGESGVLQCDMCPGGSWSAMGSSGCTLCREGEFARPGSGSCRPCQAGKAPSHDRGDCQDCPDGTHSLNGTCQACADGLVPAGDRGSCPHCGQGTYSKSGDTVCTRCRAGTYSEAASASCKPCGPGTYAAAGSGACTPCESGRYAGAESSACTPCAAGHAPLADGSSCSLHGAVLLVSVLLPSVVGLAVAVAALRWVLKRRAKAAVASTMLGKDPDKLHQAIERGRKLHVGKGLLHKAESALLTCRRKYTNYEFLLQIIEEGDLKLLKGSWLVAQGDNLRIRRQQDLPREAFWTAEDLRAQQRFVLVVAVSYCWLHKVHPDPEGDHLRTLCHASRLRLEVRGPGSVQDLALFLDYASLPQNGERGDPSNPEDGDLRTAEAQESFRRGLQQVNILYANQLVEVWMMQWVPEQEARKYMMRGWPFFEQAVAALIKDSTKLLTLEPSIQQCNNWLEVHGLSVEGRRPPMTPDRFTEAIVARSFTNGKTDADFVVRKYKETFEDVVGHATTLWFTQLGWTDAEAEELALVLPHCHSLQQLILRSNSITSRGAIALSEAAKGCPCLRGVDLSGNNIEAADEDAVTRHWSMSSIGKNSDGVARVRVGGSMSRMGSIASSQCSLPEDASPVGACEPPRATVSL